jgi:hypothetical protein
MVTDIKFHEGIFEYKFDDTNMITGIIIKKTELAYKLKDELIEDEETGEANILSFEDFARGTDIEKHIYSVVDSFNRLYILTPESLSCYENQLGLALLDYLSDNITDTTVNILHNVIYQIENDIMECEEEHEQMEEEDELTNSYDGHSDSD